MSRKARRDDRFAAQVQAGARSRTSPGPAADRGQTESVAVQLGWQPPPQAQVVPPLRTVVAPVALPPAAEEEADVEPADGLLDPAGWPLPSLFADEEPARSRRGRG